MKASKEVNETGHSFESYFKRATSPLVVLGLLEEKEMYGYELSSEMESRSGGKYKISVLYPVIYRLQEQGYVEIKSSEIVDGRARNYYAITELGRKYLEKTLCEYEDISHVFMRLMRGGNNE